MTDKQPAPGDQNWNGIVQQLRLISEHVQQDGSLPQQKQAEVEDAFRQGLAHLEKEVQHLRSGLKGSGGEW